MELVECDGCGRSFRSRCERASSWLCAACKELLAPDTDTYVEDGILMDKSDDR